jgi:hypothetical protein
MIQINPNEKQYQQLAVGSWTSCLLFPSISYWTMANSYTKFRFKINSKLNYFLIFCSHRFPREAHGLVEDGRGGVRDVE